MEITDFEYGTNVNNMPNNFFDTCDKLVSRNSGAKRLD
jgi:hypothetical protein